MQGKTWGSKDNFSQLLAKSNAINTLDSDLDQWFLICQFAAVRLAIIGANRSEKPSFRPYSLNAANGTISASQWLVAAHVCGSITAKGAWPFAKIVKRDDVPHWIFQ